MLTEHRMKPVDLTFQSGYTLVELVIVVALSAIFLAIALQNFGPRREFTTFQANVEKVKATISGAQGQGQSGRGDDHYNVNNVDSQNSGGQFGTVLCGTMLDLNSDNSTYEYYRLNAAQTRSQAQGFSNNPIADVAGPLYPYTSLGGTQTFPAGTTMTVSQGGSQVSDMHLYFIGPVTSDPTFESFAWTATNDPAGSLSNPSESCDDLVTNGRSAGTGKITITLQSSSGHLATVEYSPITGLLTSNITK